MTRIPTQVVFSTFLLVTDEEEESLTHVKKERQVHFKSQDANQDILFSE